MNIHQSLKLRAIAKNTQRDYSEHLDRISGSLCSLADSMASLQNSVIRIAGSTDRIAHLLESAEHRNSTIAAMRLLLFKHSETCGAAIKERDRVAALASCLISEKMLRQPWLDLDLFAHVSIEEMRITKEILERCSEQMSSIREMLDENDLTIVDEIIPTLEKIDYYDIKRKELSARIRENKSYFKWYGDFWCEETNGVHVPFYLRTDIVDSDVDGNTTIYELFDEAGFNLWRRSTIKWTTFTIGDINREIFTQIPPKNSGLELSWHSEENYNKHWELFLEWFSSRDPGWIVWMLKKKNLPQYIAKHWRNGNRKISLLRGLETAHSEFDNWCVELNNIDESISEIISEANLVLDGKFLIEN